MYFKFIIGFNVHLCTRVIKANSAICFSRFTTPSAQRIQGIMDTSLLWCQPEYRVHKVPREKGWRGRGFLYDIQTLS